MVGAQVTMPVADPPRPCPPADARLVGGEVGPREAVQGVDVGGVLAADEPAKRGGVLLERVPQRPDRVGPLDHRCRVVEAGEQARQRLERPRLPAPQQRGEGAPLVEAAHLDDMRDRIGMVGLVELQSRPAAHDGAHAEVDVGRQAPVEPHLLLAHVPASLRGAVVHEGQTDGLLELVRALAGEKHPGDVGLANLDLLHAVDGRVAQPSRHVGGRLAGDRRWAGALVSSGHAADPNRTLRPVRPGAPARRAGAWRRAPAGAPRARREAGRARWPASGASLPPPLGAERELEAEAVVGREEVGRPQVPGRGHHGDPADAADGHDQRQRAGGVLGRVAPGHLEHAGNVADRPRRRPSARPPTGRRSRCSP